MQYSMQNNSARCMFVILCILKYTKYAKYAKQYESICKEICADMQITCKIIVQGAYLSYFAY
jgi:hypothetical protein